MKDKIIKKIKSLAGKYNVNDIFTDWITMYALSFANVVDTYNAPKREKWYNDITSKYNEKELNIFYELCSDLILAYEEEYGDILGYIYTNLDIANKKLGQYFTPYQVCQLMAALTDSKPNDAGFYTLHEPSVGSGANVIAFCEKLIKDGINYQRCVRVVAQDISFRACFMAYIQFSLLGIPAIVYCGDTLSNPYVGQFNENVFITPMVLFQSKFLMS